MCRVDFLQKTVDSSLHVSPAIIRTGAFLSTSEISAVRTCLGMVSVRRVISSHEEAETSLHNLKFQISNFKALSRVCFCDLRWLPDVIQLVFGELCQERFRESSHPIDPGGFVPHKLQRHALSIEEEQ